MSVPSSDEEHEDCNESLVINFPTRNEDFPPLREITVGTWSVHDMNNITCNFDIIDDVRQKMKEKGVHIMGLSETKWIGNEVKVHDELIVCSSGGKEANGVAIFLAKELGVGEIKAHFITDRILMVEAEASSCNLVIIQVYFPSYTIGGDVRNDSEIDCLYDSLGVLIDRIQDDKYLVLMGNFNSMVGKRQEGDKNVIGEFGYSLRDERGEKLVNFCKRQGLVITNTLFNQTENQRHTYVSPNLGNIQLDYILVRQIHRVNVLDSRTYPEIKMVNDNMHIHIPVTMSMKVDPKENGTRRTGRHFLIDMFFKCTLF